MEAYSDVSSCPTPYCGMFGVGGLSGMEAGSEVFDFANHNIYKPYLIAASGGAVGDCEYISSGSGLEGLKPCGGGGFPVTIGNTPITAGSTNSSLDGLTLNPTTAAPARVTTLGISGVVTQAVSSTGDTANVYENTGGGALFFVAKSSNGYAGFEVQNSATGQGWQSGLLGGADEYSITNSVSGNRVLTIQPASPAGSIAVNADGSTTFGGTTTAPTVNATSAYQANGTPGITASCTVGVGTVITISQGIITACGTP
jgi:hypothetical protein